MPSMKIPGTPVYLIPLPKTAAFLVRMAGGHLRKTLPMKVRTYIWETCDSVILRARRAMLARYNWTGRAGTSWNRTGSGLGPGGVRPWASMGPEPDVTAEDPLFGRWATTPFSVPTALHEGITRHWVWLRHRGWERSNFIAWAHARGIPDPGTPNWGMFVYPGARAESAEPALHDAVMLFHAYGTFQDQIARAFDEALAV